jgi:hypothetical protein
LVKSFNSCPCHTKYRYFTSSFSLFKPRHTHLLTKLYDKRDYFNFAIVNIPVICSTSTYRVYISQLIRYSRTSGSDQDFLDRELLLSSCWIKGSWWLSVIISKVWWWPSWPGQSLRSIYVTYDHGYFPFVVVTVPSFFCFPWLISG